MFVKVMSQKDRHALVEEILARRKILKDRYKRDELQQLDASAAFEETYKPLLDPARATQKAVTHIAKASDQTVRAIENLSDDIVEVLPEMLMPETSEPETSTAADGEPRLQLFNEAGWARIKHLGPIKAAAEVPDDWNKLLLKQNQRWDYVHESWVKWIYREAFNRPQATGPKWVTFKKSVMALQREGTDPRPTQKKTGHGLRVRQTGIKTRAPTARTGGIRYYKSSSELMDRLQLLAASVSAGNNSLKIINEASEILDRLHVDGEIDDRTFEGLLRVFI